MQWPADHPAVTDPELAPWRHGAEELCPDATVRRVLRHLPGRRVASLVTMSNQKAVLKIFASPRARGNTRRLDSLAGSGAGPFVPRALGVDAVGHVALVSWAPGTVFDQLDDGRFVRTAAAVGAALRALHTGGARLDRSWTVVDELTLLDRRCLPHDGETTAHLVDEPLVPAHRDCHPRQVVSYRGTVRWIDLDDAAMAPPGLDVGNFMAHLRADALFGRRSPEPTRAALSAFRSGYGDCAGDVAAWERLTLIRLAGLAVSRHGQPGWREAILDELAEAGS